MQNQDEINKNVERKRSLFIESLENKENVYSFSSKLYSKHFKRALRLFLTSYSVFEKSFKIADFESKNTITETQYNYMHKVKDNILG